MSKKKNAAASKLAKAATGRPVAIVVRNSGQGGVRARRSVAKEARRAVKDYKRHTKVDVLAKLPPEDELVQMLENTTMRVRSRDSKNRPFTNEYVVHWITDDVVLLMSTGSARKLDKSTMTVPFLDWFNDNLKFLNPRIVLWHRIDRVFRTDLLIGETLNICREQKITIIDGRRGRVGTSGYKVLETFLQAFRSAEEAAEIPKKTRDGQSDATKIRTIPKDGLSVPYGIGGSVPPGMMLVRMKSATGLKGERWLFFDTPSCYPKAKKVAYGIPEIFLDDDAAALGDELATAVGAARGVHEDSKGHMVAAASSDPDQASAIRAAADRAKHKKKRRKGQHRKGQRADQVAAVRWALHMLGRPGYGYKEVAVELMRRKFSTDKLRSAPKSPMYYNAEQIGSKYWRVLRPILKRLRFYLTGKLRVRFGVDDVKNFTIKGCFPPDGKPWMTQADYDRILEYLAKMTGGGPAKLGLVGVIVKTPAGDFPLRKAPTGRGAAGPSYILKPADAGVRGALTLPALPHYALASSIVECLAEYADSLLIPLLEEEIPQIEVLRRKRREAERHRDQVRQRRDALLANFERVLDDETAQALDERRRKLDEEEWRPALLEVRRAKSAVGEAVRKYCGENAGLAAKLLARLVASLRDPEDTEFNDLWKSAVVIDKIDTTPVVVHSHAGTLTRWEGTIRITGADHVFSAPFHGEYLQGAAAQVYAKAEYALDQLLVGVPFRQIEQTNAKGVRSALAELLCFDTRYFGLAVCDDPRLVRIAANLAMSTDRNVDQVAVRLGEPVELVTVVLAQLNSGRPTWDSVTRCSAYAAAS